VALTDEAIEKIKSMIVSGTLRAGDRLPKEADLAAELGLVVVAGAMNRHPMYSGQPGRPSNQPAPPACPQRSRPAGGKPPGPDRCGEQSPDLA